MHKLLKVLITSIALLMLSACSDSEPNLPEYRITKDITEGSNKRSVEVELRERTDEATLRLLANEIYSSSKVNVNRTFIGYRIAGPNQSETYWASTHYTPKLTVVIYGANDSDFAKMQETTEIDEEVIGTWLVSRGIEYKITAYEKDGMMYLKQEFDDDSTSEDVYERSTSEKGTRLQNESGKEFKEYFIINAKGELEFWSENGNYYTASLAKQ